MLKRYPYVCINPAWTISLLPLWFKLAIGDGTFACFNNVFKNHSVGLFPQAFYFSNSGWRFGLSANYIFTTSDFSSVFDASDINANPNQQAIGPTTNSNLNLNFSLRKEFGIPIPFAKQSAATTTFISFLDINGNGIKEKDETLYKKSFEKKFRASNIDVESVTANMSDGILTIMLDKKVNPKKIKVV